ncbi:MAG: discoidin domain-containing protein [Thermodesulfobacteriota bacterium]
MRGRLLDDFADLSGWTSFASGQARLTLSPDIGRAGMAMRLDFDFHGGGGFVGARKAFALDIPESYSFGFNIRGSAPANIFEFKLVDGSNQNVWRYRVEEFAFPEDWQSMRLRNSQIDFAWGPLGGGPPRDVAAIEFVVAAGPGGKGTVWLEDLHFQDETYRSTPLVRASSALRGHDSQHVLDPIDPSTWRSEPSHEPQWLLIDFQQEREYGGLVIQWEKGFRGKHFDVQVSDDGLAWNTLAATTQGDSDRSYLYLPRTLSRYLRLNLFRSVRGRGFGIQGILVKPHDFSRSLNHFFQNIAREHPAGLYPKYLLGRQTYWTSVGTGQGHGVALLNEEGMVEVDKGSFSIMPFLYTDGRLITWADVALEQGLAQEHLPIPYSVWRSDALRMTATAFADGEAGHSTLYLRYRLENTSGRAQSVTLFAAVLPLQVTPTWQNWRSYGGVSPIRALTWRNGVLRVNGTKAVVPLTAVGGFGAAAFAQGWVAEHLVRGELPARSTVKDEFGHASGALRFDLEILPRSTQDVILAVPFGMVKRPLKGLTDARPQGLSGTEVFENAISNWESRLGSVEILAPAQAQDLVNTFKTAAAHILINRDGPALHPGPRRYDRSWIRDGAIMGAALMRVGFPDPIRDFIRWYAKYQSEDGNVPDCVDREGTEWLPEFDAYGQFIYCVMEHYRFTSDRAFVSEMRPAAAKALSYMEGLRRKRLMDEYRTPEKKACYGLLPESMSHEGYMAHPVHAYWDDFWALRGIRDAALMAEVLGDNRESARLSALQESFAQDVRASLAATMEQHKIDFVPGSVEFADFDPTATSIAVNLLDQLHLLPPTQTNRTFDIYLEGFRKRASGSVNWNNYSAYEIRIIGALVRLGRRHEAMELMRFMLADRRIPAWNQWPEISWRDPLGPSFIGDLPHTWISAEYILAVRTMFAYERGSDESLVLAAGIDVGWLKSDFAVGIRNLPTYYGNLTYSLRLDGKDSLRLTLEGDLNMPPGGIVVIPPLPRPIRQVEINGRPLTEFTPDTFTCRECPAASLVKF